MTNHKYYAEGTDVSRKLTSEGDLRLQDEEREMV